MSLDEQEKLEKQELAMKNRLETLQALEADISAQRSALSFEAECREKAVRKMQVTSNSIDEP